MTAQPSPAVDDYFASFPAEVQDVLNELRRRIHRAAPGCTEQISYKIAAFRLRDRVLIYVGGWKQHIGLYPIPELDEATAAALEPYRTKTSTIRLPLNKPIPYDLIEQVVTFAARRPAR